MRKINREITEIEDICDLIHNLDTIRIGLYDDQYPYIVPVSFGYEYTDGELVFYFHGAKVGKKVDLLLKNPHVCIEGDICYRYKDTKTSVTCLYESIIGFGKAEKLEGEEAARGLQQILNHCGYGNHAINDKIFTVTAVYKVTIDSITGKARDKHN